MMHARGPAHACGHARDTLAFLSDSEFSVPVQVRACVRLLVACSCGGE
jgi:hypothetical protein